ncbi:hypothetical protein [Erythrobacter ani]|uniref:Secreted protein n=1 Tax=Erythrobacter ani TaxID=2827235 RepID=A0ABS6SQS7_9SPHN|nr:hypothetical protein [Erythrobacter ani]MBV7266738.1 hypothetical protein [Erythrobacter ani]
MLSKSRTGAVAGLIAAISMTATPAAADDLPRLPASVGSSIYADFDHSAYDGEFESGEWRRWGRRGWRRGGWHRRRGIRGGDILAGVLILGGIAAVASAANNNRRHRDRDVVIVDRRDRDYDRRDRDYDRRDNRRGYNASASGLDNAVDQCVRQIERDVRVDTVDGVDRTAQGWVVTGALFNGEGFSCRIDNEGRVDDINYGSFRGSSFDPDAAVRARGDDRQWTDASYIAAREANAAQPAAIAGTDEPLPAYPGGPIPGEQVSEEIDADIGG